MANIRKTFNFRNGVQVDEDNLIVNPLGLVGIGTTVPTEALDVRGTAKVVGLVTASEVSASAANFLNSVDVGNTVNIDATSGFVTAVKYFGDASGLSNIYAIAVDGWLVESVGLSTFSNIGIGTTTASSDRLLVIGNASISGIVTASDFYGSGIGLTSLNASNITLGTLDTERLPSNIQISGIITASHIESDTLNVGVSTIVVLESSISSIDYLSNVNLISGISTISTLNASIGNISTITSLNLSSNVGSISSLSSLMISSGFSTITNAYIGIATIGRLNSILSNLTFIENTNLNTSGIATIAQLNSNNATIGTLDSSAAQIGILTATDIIGDNLTVSALNAQSITSDEFQTTNVTIDDNIFINSGNLYVNGITTSTGGFVGNLTGNVSGVADVALDVDSSANLTISSLNVSGSISAGTSITGTDGYYINNLEVDNNIYANGEIGIQTNNPQSGIHIFNSSDASLQVTGENESVLILGRSIDKTQNTSGLRFGNTSGSFPDSTSSSYDIINYDTGNVNNYLHLGNPSGINTGNFNWIYGKSLSTPLMTLTYEGNLGIGITTPYYPLTVSGIGTFTNSLYVGNNLNVVGNIFGTNGSYTGIVTSLRIGIQTNNPQSDLHIFNSSDASLQVTGQSESLITLGRSINQTQNTGGLRFGNTDLGTSPYSTESSLDVINYDTGNVNNYLHFGNFSGINTGNFNWIYENNALMTLTYEGNLGIGITTPYYPLTVSGIGTFTNSLYVGNNLNVVGNISASNITSSSIISSSVTSNLTGNVNATSGVSTFATLSSNSSSVGFLTASTLNVTSILSADSSYGVQIGDQEIFDSVVVATASTIGVGTDTLIGINTTGISIGLQININEYPDIFPNQTFVTSIGIDEVGIGTTTANLEEFNDLPLNFGFPNSGDDLIKITPTGNIGIGTIDPKSKLDVYGNVNVTGIVTAQNGFASGIGVTNPVQIIVSGNILTFNVVGVGSTSLVLY